MGCNRPEWYCGGTDEYPVDTVTLSPYRLAETETTFWQWALYCAATDQDVNQFAPSWGLKGDHPAVNVNWYDAALYANWRNARAGRDTVYIFFGRYSYKEEVFPDAVEIVDTIRGAYRLPTEAEWEFAAREGKNESTLYSGSDTLDLVGWYRGNSEELGIQSTHPVATKRKNALGFYDLSGNVREWCRDWTGAYPKEKEVNPVGPPDGDFRVLRGGSWDYHDIFCRVSDRFYFDPRVRGNYVGFRLAQD